MNTRHEADQLSAAHYDRKWKEIIAQMPQGGDYCFYMRQYGYDIIKDAIKPGSKVFDFACGLGIIDMQLEVEKRCRTYGCDISKIAIHYIHERYVMPLNHFKIGQEIFGTGYDYIIATYFLEHIPDPADWLNYALEYGKKVIFSIPNNFKQAGEHMFMQWHDWDSFYELFKDFKLARIDEGKYHPWLPAAYHHPTFICEKK